MTRPGHWRRRVAVLLLVSSLTQGIAGQAGAPYAPHPSEYNGIRSEHGGGDGGGGSGM